MSLFGNITSSIGKFLLPIGTAALQAAAPVAGDAVKSLFGKVIGDGLDAAKSFGQGLVSGLPGPFGKLASNLLGKAADAVKGMATQGMEKWVNELVAKVSPQKIETGATVNVAPSTLPVSLGGRDTAAEANQITGVINNVTAGKTGGPSQMDNVKDMMAAMSGFTADESTMLNSLQEPDKTRETFKLKLQKRQEMLAFVSGCNEANHSLAKTVLDSLKNI
jgi:hypothetical protein